MKGLWVFVVISLFLISFVSARGITGSAIENNSQEGNKAGPNNETIPPEPKEEEFSTMNNGEELENRIKEFNGEEIKRIFNESNKLEFHKECKSNNETNEEECEYDDENKSCPPECNCTGSTIKCYLEDGTREMTIYAGKSGNIIYQIKGENMTTNVTLYKSDDKIYGMFDDNDTKEVRMFPDQIKERMREKLEIKLKNESIILDENGTYQYEAENEAKLFGLLKIKEKVQAQIDSETGEVKEIKKPWWSIFTKEEEGEQLLGASCGTVTPGYNDECCQTKDYDFWNATASECQFNSTE